MSEKRLVSLLILLNLIALNGIVLAVMNLRYPFIGHDYTYSIPSFLDTALHFRLNGFGIQWFTPTFGGGLPAFPNPNHMQYSLPGLLAAVLPPWPAMMLSAVFFVSAGFLGAYYFLHQTLGVHWTAGLLGAFFFSANGFVITRFATGQLGYFVFPLLPVLLILLLEKRLPTGITVPGLGLLIGAYIHSAGYFILIIHGLSILVFLPLLFLVRPALFEWRRLFWIVFWGGLIGLLIAASKLAATFAFTRYFPRLIADNYPVPLPVGLSSILLQLLGTQTLVPVFLLAGLAPSTYTNLVRAATGTHYGMWELDISITPVVFMIFLIAFIQMLHHPNQSFLLLRTKQQQLALVALLFFVWLAVEFTLAKGLMYPVLRQLPILSSLRGNIRFTGVFILPLTFFAALLYERWSRTWGQPKQLQAYLALGLLAALPLSSYFLFEKDMFWMFYDIADPHRIYQQILAGDSFEIIKIGSPPGNNTGALLYRTSNLNLYEPVFGFELEYFHPQVQNGAVWNTSNGYYNMTNPTGYLYPDLNNTTAFQRFRLEDKETLELFVHHIQPNWKIPTYQIVLNWISGLSLLGALFSVVIQVILHRRNRALDLSCATLPLV